MARPCDWLKWQVMRAWERVGTLDLLIAASAFLLFGLYWFVIIPLQGQFERTAQTHERQIREHQLSVKKVANPSSATTSALAAFVQGFPEEGHREGQIDQLHVLAQKAGISVDRIDYHLDPVQALPLRKLTLRVSAAGPYEADRAFLHELLKTFGNVAVERLSLEKDKDSTILLHFSLELGLYYREAQ